MDAHTPTAAQLPSPDEAPLDDAIRAAGLLLEQYGHVVVAYPASLPVAHERRLYTVRSVLESHRLALVKLDLPPLGTAVLVRQLRQLSICDFGPGVIASAARLLSHYVYAGALLHSVAKLDRVPVGLKSHAKSWVPGAQFAVLASPAPELIKVGSGGQSDPPLLTGPDFATRMVLARGQAQPDWVSGTLAPHWQAQGVDEVPLPAASSAWWGTPKLVEFAAFLPDIAILYQLVSSVRREACSWCGIELIGDLCGFCAAPVAPGGSGGSGGPGSPGGPGGPGSLHHPDRGRSLPSGVLGHGTPAG
ncbi:MULTISPECIES: hypothetical protein [Streptomyces]|uniref:hypothetical protein n=1 Tax=Streptomyces TaxID=1883 RepID=UPI00025CD9E9|nr:MULTISPECIES: hypothetical protein [Streptomyces]AZK96217.1 hypothetical protein B7R87_21860 [Streptomyces tsukubensis]EIF92190.1 hypothetical protein [Streptomyces tsukubensis NRRL18488]